MIRQAVLLTFLLVLPGCGAGKWADQVAVTKLPPEQQRAALGIRVFDQTMAPPEPKRIIGEVRAVSCKNKSYQPPATKGDALSQLRVKALSMGANAVTSVTYDERGVSFNPNCWESVTASGVAVEL